jgi:hypothetical protein
MAKKPDTGVGYHQVAIAILSTKEDWFLILQDKRGFYCIRRIERARKEKEMGLRSRRGSWE